MLDANVIVSGVIFPDSVPGAVMARVKAHCTMLQSTDTLKELADVLCRPKFERWLGRASRERELIALGRFSEHIANLPTLDICRDPRDNKYLELAQGGKADVLVTGDLDLLVIERHAGTAILTPRTFIEIPNAS